jgi:hypothetical protein
MHPNFVAFHTAAADLNPAPFPGFFSAALVRGGIALVTAWPCQLRDQTRAERHELSGDG